jgi:hypothetical protein
MRQVAAIVLLLLAFTLQGAAQVYDTLRSGEQVFTSQPIPFRVRARMIGKSMPDDATVTFNDLRYLKIPYYDFEGKVQQGEMVCNKAIAHDLLDIFKTLFEAQYPICSIRLIDDFDADDETSMRANNTSCFCYRTIAGSKQLSQHALGRAVDVNPLQNPYVDVGVVQPATAGPYADRTKDFPHKIDANDLCKKVFVEHGFIWAGDWPTVAKDYQHFEKRAPKK